jgi:hypothetical protein
MKFIILIKEREILKEKAFEKHSLDNKIFNVHPRSGKLEPGE